MTVAAQHLRSLQEYPFDSVLLPYNFPMSRNAGYIADFEALVAVCRRARRWPSRRSRPSPAHRGVISNRLPTPGTSRLTDQDAIDTAVSWVLGRDGVFLNTVGDIHILPKVIDAAERFTRRPSDEEMRALEDAFGLEPLFV